jgi:hypothetical protein
VPRPHACSGAAQARCNTRAAAAPPHGPCNQRAPNPLGGAPAVNVRATRLCSRGSRCGLAAASDSRAGPGDWICSKSGCVGPNAAEPGFAHRQHLGRLLVAPSGPLHLCGGRQVVARGPPPHACMARGQIRCAMYPVSVEAFTAPAALRRAASVTPPPPWPGGGRAAAGRQRRTDDVQGNRADGHRRYRQVQQPFGVQRRVSVSYQAIKLECRKA